MHMYKIPITDNTGWDQLDMAELVTFAPNKAEAHLKFENFIEEYNRSYLEVQDSLPDDFIAISAKDWDLLWEVKDEVYFNVGSSY